MKLSAALSILLATAAVASPAPDPVPNVEVPEVTAKPDAMAVRDALAAAACHPNKTCLSDASKVPHCATSCIESAAKKVKCTGTTNLNCQCKSSSQIQSLAQSCVISDCGAATAISVLQAVSKVCVCNKNHPYSKCPPPSTA